MELKRRATKGEGIELLVLDFRDAFYMLPLLPEERKYFVAHFRGSFYLWERIAQGSLNGPGVFGRLSALTGRMTQSLFPSEYMQLQIYTDDPCAVMRGTPKQTKRMAVVLSLFWRALGWGLSYHKGQLGCEVNWIGFHFKITAQDVIVSIKADFMHDFTKLVKELADTRKISNKTVRAFAGKANHVCNLLYSWRPFISELWAAIYSESASRSGTVWCKQILGTLTWMRTFLDGHRGSLIRSWNFTEYLHPRATGTFYLDASPWGLGGVLVIDCRVHSFFATKLTRDDEHFLKAKIGSDESQQIFEALAILVAFRVWLPVIRSKKVVLTLTSDNTSALAMSAKLKITASTLIARELALTLCEASFQPRFIEHLPGVMNGHADSLSRLFQPGGRYKIPEALAACKRVHPPRRNAAFYTTLATESQGG